MKILIGFFILALVMALSFWLPATTSVEIEIRNQPVTVLYLPTNFSSAFFDTSEFSSHPLPTISTDRALKIGLTPLLLNLSEIKNKILWIRNFFGSGSEISGIRGRIEESPEKVFLIVAPQILEVGWPWSHLFPETFLNGRFVSKNKNISLSTLSQELNAPLWFTSKKGPQPFDPLFVSPYRFENTSFIVTLLGWRFSGERSFFKSWNLLSENSLLSFYISRYGGVYLYCKQEAPLRCTNNFDELGPEEKAKAETFKNGLMEKYSDEIAPFLNLSLDGDPAISTLYFVSLNSSKKKIPLPELLTQLEKEEGTSEQAKLEWVLAHSCAEDRLISSDPPPLQENLELERKLLKILSRYTAPSQEIYNFVYKCAEKRSLTETQKLALKTINRSKLRFRFVNSEFESDRTKKYFQFLNSGGSLLDLKPDEMNIWLVGTFKAYFIKVAEDSSSSQKKEQKIRPMIAYFDSLYYGDSYTEQAAAFVKEKAPELWKNIFTAYEKNRAPFTTVKDVQ